MADVYISDDVRGVLLRSSITNNLLVLPGQLSRDLYLRTNAVLNNCGGKWNKKAKGHVFACDPRLKLGLAMGNGVARDEKKTRQAFFTPPEIAKLVVSKADVIGKFVIEPSAGDGALALEIRRQGGIVTACFEIDPDCCAVLRAQGFETYGGDFLTRQPHFEKCERIVMNPPFAKCQAEKHVEHALRYLEPGGILTTILPASERVIEKVKSLIVVKHAVVTPLPADSFKESGTGVSTVYAQLLKY